MRTEVKVGFSVIWSLIFTEFSNWTYKIFNRKDITNIKVSFVDDLYAIVSFVLCFPEM